MNLSRSLVERSLKLVTLGAAGRAARCPECGGPSAACWSDASPVCSQVAWPPLSCFCEDTWPPCHHTGGQAAA